MAKIQNISRDVNGISVDQRVVDGFINATAMCVAHNKDISDWLALNSVFELVSALAVRLDIESNSGNSPNSVKTRVSSTYPTIVIVRRGSPEKGGGTWIHPKLAVHLAQWCSPEFALQVSDWIEEWITTGQNPIRPQQADIDRVVYRDVLKDDARLRMTAQVKVHLEQIQKYDDKKYSGMFFARVHDAINIAITTETSKQMKVRISQMLGRDVKEQELIRDYFPPMVLQRYISVCEASANFMLRENLHPLTAVERAIEIVLPANYLPESIDFSENIKFVRQRLSQPILGQVDFLPPS